MEVVENKGSRQRGVGNGSTGVGWGEEGLEERQAGTRFGDGEEAASRELISDDTTECSIILCRCQYLTVRYSGSTSWTGERTGRLPFPSNQPAKIAMRRLVSLDELYIQVYICLALLSLDFS